MLTLEINEEMTVTHYAKGNAKLMSNFLKTESRVGLELKGGNLVVLFTYEHTL